MMPRTTSWIWGLTVVGALSACETKPARTCDDDGNSKKTKKKRVTTVPSGVPDLPVKLRAWGKSSPYRYQVDDDTILEAFVLGARGELPLEPLDSGRQRVLAATPGSLLGQAGFRVGDEIIAVAGTSLKDDDWLVDAREAWRRDLVFSVSIERNGEKVELTYTRAPPPPPRPTPVQASEALEPWNGKEIVVEVPRAKVDALLDNQAELMRSVRIVPNRVDGRIEGVRVFGIRPSSTIHDFGLRNGDRVARVGGYDIGAPDRALEAYTKLRGAEEVRVDIERRGKRLTLVCRITP